MQLQSWMTWGYINENDARYDRSCMSMFFCQVGHEAAWMDLRLCSRGQPPWQVASLTGGVKCNLLQAILMAEKRILKSNAFKACRAFTNDVLMIFDSQNFHPWQFRPSEWNTKLQSWEHTKIDAKFIHSGSYCGRSRQFLPWLLQITWSYQFLRTLGNLCFPACLLFLKLVALVGRTQICVKWLTWSQLLWIRRPPKSYSIRHRKVLVAFCKESTESRNGSSFYMFLRNFWSCWMSV